jgi:hypothetical protein
MKSKYYVEKELTYVSSYWNMILVDVVMVSPFLQATKALRESRGIALLCF